MSIEVILSRALRARGEQTRSLESGVRRGRFVRIRPGAYAIADEWRAASPQERHRAAMDALVATAARVPVFSHESAAMLHGIPIVGEWPGWPHTVAPELGHRPPTGVFVHRPRHPVLLGDVDGILATTPVCTAVNLAASRPLRTGVAALDCVLADGVAKEDIARVARSWKPFHGSRRVERALEIATGLAETPLESISLVPIALAGFDRPQQQVDVVARGRRYRLDFFWPGAGAGVVGEADGRGKYETRDDLWEEKQREDALRASGFGFARWGWDDALAGHPVVDRLLEAGLRVGPPFAKRAARTS
jgi:hypothetical protein